MNKLQQLTLAVLAVVLFNTAAVAQTQKGNLMVGGNISNFGLDFLDGGGTRFSMDITPKVAYFIKDDLALGGYAKMGLVTAKDAGTTTQYGIGALGRYFIQDSRVRKLEFSRRARFFLEANAGFGGSSNSNTDASTTGLDIGFGPGLAYFITPNVALEALLKYELTVGFGSATTSNRLNLGVGFQIYLPTAKAREIIREEGGR
ncbi:outer membrane beta-barrel protein [Chitinophaga japonensis]|uniref:Outer membrane protein with beta-barrel domain n=1 Tax=Chitinophaga japonensis TaxID=104662 RepID=A0A562T3L8_CHIJA|nr:outer membrane beta-barrel protein [Chitinophaga japonensis]TWI88102.1 outer membrane protein with beta-barrel domain [Chitinophaga japonensis]